VQSEVRVLLAGVDGPLGALLTETLRRDGCAVARARQESELACATVVGLRRTLRDCVPDVVICDLRARGRRGLELLRRLRRVDWAVPVITITRPDDDATSVEADRLGVCAIFESPFAVDDLRTAVQNLRWVR